MNNQIEKVITDAIKQISQLTNVNLIVGSPITSKEGTTVIPISKVTVGFLSGGGEYGNVKIAKGTDLPYSGASGGMVSVKPSGFLVEGKKGIKFIHCPDDIFEKAFDTCEELLKNLNEKTSEN